MGIKYRNLLDLYNRKINVHDFKQATNLSDLMGYAENNDKFSIRFDSETDYHGRPFYKYNASIFSSDEESVEYLSEIANEATEKKCTMICANGHMYDDIQICNFVININKQYEFILEWSTASVPLREMYQYKTTVLKGNIHDSIKDMEIINRNDNKLDDKQIEEILVWSLSLNCFNKNIEATLYPIEVGLYKEKIVCWQTD